MFQVKKLSENATIPTRRTPNAAGYDLYAAHDEIILYKNKGLIKTDIVVKIPEGYYGRIAPRSPLVMNYYTSIGDGVVDADYRGNLGVVIFNHHPKKNLGIKKGDLLAQLILTKIITPEIQEVESLANTERSEGGFLNLLIN